LSETASNELFERLYALFLDFPLQTHMPYAYFVSINNVYSMQKLRRNLMYLREGNKFYVLLIIRENIEINDEINKTILFQTREIIF